jgi:hypothetical protein
MSAATLEEPKAQRPRDDKGRLLPRNAPPEPKPIPCPISVELLQAYVDSVVKNLQLPSVNPQVPPLESYWDEDAQKQKNRPRKACELDEQGNVIYGSGPVVPDQFAIDLWEKVRPEVEQAIHRTIYAMSESILVPGRDGKIDDRSKVMQEIRGRFVIVDAK